MPDSQFLQRWSHHHHPSWPVEAQKIINWNDWASMQSQCGSHILVLVWISCLLCHGKNLWWGEFAFWMGSFDGAPWWWHCLQSHDSHLRWQWHWSLFCHHQWPKILSDDKQFMKPPLPSAVPTFLFVPPSTSDFKIHQVPFSLSPFDRASCKC